MINHLITRIFLVVIIILSVLLAYFYYSYESAKEQYKISEANYKAATMKNVGHIQRTYDLSDENRKILKDAKIKEKNVKSIRKMKTVATKTDSIRIEKLVIKENTHIDTVIGNKWYSLNMSIRSPNLIVVKPQFTDSLIMVDHVSKEYVGRKKPWPLY